MISLNIDKLAHRKRRDCIDGERPCPWVRCRHHMIWFIYGIHKKSDDEIVDLIFNLPETCTLDVADRGDQTLQTIADIFGISRERIRQIENYQKHEKGALGKLRSWTESGKFGHLRDLLPE